MRAREMWGMPHLLVISKVVPKIWARTNSAMVDCVRDGSATVRGWGYLWRRVGGSGGAVGEAQVNRFARWAGQAADWSGGEGR